MTENVPPQRRQSLGGGSVLPIKALTNMYTKWKIHARVVEKSQINTFNRKQSGGGEGHVFSCVVIDKEGTQINMKFWNSCAQDWYPKLEKGKAYSFSKGRIQLANKRYSGTVNHDYEITYDREADISPIDDDGTETTTAIPLNRTVQYQSLRAVNMSTKKMPFITNVLVVIHSWQQARDVAVQGGESRKRRLVTVVDATQFALDVTLWGEHAEADETVFESHPVVALHNLQIREWRGRAGSTLSTSEVLWNFQETEEAKSLKAWYEANSHTSEFEPMSNIAGEQQQGTKPVAVRDAAINELDEILEETGTDGNLIVRCTAYITSLLYRNPRQNNAVNIVYEACPKCQRKLAGEGGNDHCNNCHEAVSPAPRLAFTAILSDGSAGGFMVRIFNEVAQRLVGLSAARCLELQSAANAAPDDPPHPDLLTAFEHKCIYQRYQFTLRGRRDTYMQELRNQFAVVSLIPAAKGTITGVAMKRCMALCPTIFDTAVSNKRVCLDEDVEGSAPKRSKVDQ